MFDIGFLEVVLLGLVSLVVLGPERMPGAIRTVSLWVGRLRRSFNNVKQDIEREIGADEIRRQLRNEAIMEKFKQTKAQVNDTLNSVRKETEELRKSADLESQMASLNSSDTAKPQVSATAPKVEAPAASAPIGDPAASIPPASTSPTAGTAEAKTES
jgi:sec-independent protein translocase protein TatB